MPKPRNRYIGRFAPSPTGKLHFGSLVAAVASYIDAKAHNGQWLLRIEDLDPPREEIGATAHILQGLDAHHLHWDKPVVYQSQRLAVYAEALDKLSPWTYPCDCPRHRITALGGLYDGYCREQRPPATAVSALRLKTDQLSSKQQILVENFNDCIVGSQTIPLSHIGDFILRRKDQLFAYQLAVAIDDNAQQISHIIRGHDLLGSTSRQRYILALLDMPLPHYGHTPLVLGIDGHKLSKQTKAPPINNAFASNNLINALTFLGHPPPMNELADQRCSTILEWAIQSWQRESVPTQPSSYSHIPPSTHSPPSDFNH